MQGPTLTWNHCSVLYTSKWEASYLSALFKVGAAVAHAWAQPVVTH